MQQPRSTAGHFSRRPRRERTDVAERWIWLSRCRRFRVTLSRFLLGRGTRGELADVWRVERWDPPDARCPWGSWSILSEHRRRAAAFRAAERVLNAKH